MAVSHYPITATDWTQITNSGESGVCWMSNDPDGDSGQADVRIYQSIDKPTVSAKMGIRIWRPNCNNDIQDWHPTTPQHKMWARCVNLNDVVVLAVKVLPINNINEQISLGKMGYIQFLTQAQAAPTYIWVEVKSKPVTVLTMMFSSAKVITGLWESIIPNRLTAVPITIRNRNRNYPDNFLLVKLHQISSFSGGINLTPRQSGYGTNPGQSVSGVGDMPIPTILKANTDYGLTTVPSTPADINTLAFGWED